MDITTRIRASVPPWKISKRESSRLPSLTSLRNILVSAVTRALNTVNAARGDHTARLHGGGLGVGGSSINSRFHRIEEGTAAVSQVRNIIVQKRKDMVM